MSQIITQPETSEKTLLTYSALNTFRNCPRKYKNRYLDNLRPRERAEALSFGSVIHTAIELWYRLPDTESRLPDVLAYIDDAFENRVVDPNQMVQWHLATANRLVVTINSFRNELNMIHKQLISACALMLLVLAGCDSGIVNVRALPTPEPEQPPANLPVQLHQRNWTGSLGQGSCVHASLVNHLRWLNRFELGERWRTTYAAASGTHVCVIAWMLPALTTATRSRPTHASWIGPARLGEEQSSGGSRRIHCA